MAMQSSGDMQKVNDKFSHFTSLPGPDALDHKAKQRYLNERHLYVTELHEKYGDVFQWSVDPTEPPQVCLRVHLINFV